MPLIETIEMAEMAAGDGKVDLGRQTDHDIWTAAQLGNLFRVQQLVQEQPELAQTPGPTDQVPPLHWAALNNRVSVAKYLLERGAPVNALGGDQWSTALHWAACKGYLDVLSLLVAWGADMNIKDQPGYTALHLAAQHGQTLAVVYFLALNVEVDQRDSFGRTPLLWAAFRGHLETAQVLIQEGADVDAIDDGGMTILHWAVIKNNFHIARLLLKNRADPTVKDREGRTACDWATNKGHYDWYASLLIEFGRKSLLRNLSMLRANYWRQPRSVGKFMLGKVIPILFLPSMWLILWKVSPWFLGVAMVVACSMLLDNVIRPVLFPSLLQMETGMIMAYQLVLVPATIVLEVTTIMPTTKEHWSIHLGWFILITGAIYFLHRTHTTDPGIIRPSMNKEDRHKVVIDLVADGELNRRKYCVTCRIRKPLRSKHCRICDFCVAKFDHHCPWTHSCVGVGNHRPFIWYVYLAVGVLIGYVWLTLLYLRTLNVDGISPGRFCVLGEWMCRRSVVAPFVVVFMLEKIFFIIWVGFLLVTQTWQIAKNKTTNEMSNWHRLEYFQVRPDEDNATEERQSGDHNGQRHRHSAHCKHATKTRTVNPFDRGTLSNCANFCFGAGDHVYYELHQVPEGRREPTPVELPVSRLEKNVKLESKPLMGVHIV